MESMGNTNNQQQFISYYIFNELPEIDHDKVRGRQRPELGNLSSNGQLVINGSNSLGNNLQAAKWCAARVTDCFHPAWDRLT